MERYSLTEQVMIAIYKANGEPDQPDWEDIKKDKSWHDDFWEQIKNEAEAVIVLFSEKVHTLEQVIANQNKEINEYRTDLNQFFQLIQIAKFLLHLRNYKKDRGADEYYLREKEATWQTLDLHLQIIDRQGSLGNG